MKGIFNELFGFDCSYADIYITPQNCYLLKNLAVEYNESGGLSNKEDCEIKNKIYVYEDIQ